MQHGFKLGIKLTLSFINLASDLFSYVCEISIHLFFISQRLRSKLNELLVGPFHLIVIIVVFLFKFAISLIMLVLKVKIGTSLCLIAFFHDVFDPTSHFRLDIFDAVIES